MVLILLDLSAGFETDDHTISPQSLLCRFGFKGKVFDWFRSYLENHTRFVKIDDTVSVTRPLDCRCSSGLSFRSTVDEALIRFCVSKREC